HLRAVGDAEIEARIAAYETAFRMQTSVPELADVSREPAAIHALYGTEPGRASFANNCLLARRLVERGVRFVQLYHRGWDHHGDKQERDIVNGLPALCRETDRATAALIQDLRQRGLLDTTLVVWGGEFGRTPMNEERDGSPYPGRDHHIRAFTMWLAGGGIKPGVTIGATDDLGYNIVADPVHVHDLHATILHLMGIEHTKLTFRFPGRGDQRPPAARGPAPPPSPRARAGSPPGPSPGAGAPGGPAVGGLDQWDAARAPAVPDVGRRARDDARPGTGRPTGTRLAPQVE